MRYQSIIHFFNYCQIDCSDISAINIARLKKQAAAEFAMDADGIIHIDDFHYTKNEVFAEIERSNFAERLPYHLQVWNNKGLLHFLETGTVDLKKITWANFRNNEAFVAFVSPYFAEPYNDVMRGFLQNSDWRRANKWLSYKDFILPDDEETAYKSIRTFANEGLRTFRNLNSENYYSKKDELKGWAKNGCAAFFNNLPDCLYFLSDDIARWLIHVTVELQKKEKRLCFRLSQQLVKLKNISLELKKLIEKNHKIYKRKSGYGIGIDRRLFVILWLIVLIIREAGTCTGDRTSSSGSGYNILVDKEELAVQNMTAFRKTFLDSIANDRKNATDKNSIQPLYSFLYVYLLFENNVQDSSIFPINIANQSNHPICIYIVSDDNLTGLQIEANKILSINPGGKILDILLDGENKKNNDILSLNQFQYIHFANSDSSSITNNPVYNDNNTLNIDSIAVGKPTVTVVENGGFLYFNVSKNLHVISSGAYRK